MKIGLVTAHYPPEFTGGTEVVVRAQARELARSGHDVRVYSGSDRTRAASEAVMRESLVDGIPVTRFLRRADETYDLALERLEIGAEIEAECQDLDLVHVHHWSTLCRDLVRRLARHVPVVVTLHDHFASCARFFRASPVAGLACPTQGSVEPCVRCIAADARGIPAPALETALVERQSAFESELAAASLVLAPSASHAGTVERLLDLDCVRVLEHGICQPWARPVEREIGAYDGRRPLVVLHFGHRSRAKGTLDLVRALAPLAPGTAELWLCGREIEPGLDSELSREAGATRIVFHAPYDSEGPRRLAARADLAAFPSRLRESYSLVVDEALALGLPVWVADRGAQCERIQARSPDAPTPGRVLPAEDSAAWTAAFRELVRSPAMLEESRRAVPARMKSAAEVAGELSSMYRELVSSHRRPGTGPDHLRQPAA